MTPIDFHRVSLLPNHYPKIVAMFDVCVQSAMAEKVSPASQS